MMSFNHRINRFTLLFTERQPNKKHKRMIYNMFNISKTQLSCPLEQLVIFSHIRWAEPFTYIFYTQLYFLRVFRLVFFRLKFKYIVFLFLLCYHIFILTLKSLNNTLLLSYTVLKDSKVSFSYDVHKASSVIYLHYPRHYDLFKSFNLV